MKFAKARAATIFIEKSQYGGANIFVAMALKRPHKAAMGSNIAIFLLAFHSNIYSPPAKNSLATAIRMIKPE